MQPIIIVTVLSFVLPLFIHYKMPEGWCRLIVSTVVSCVVVVVLIYTIGLTATERNFIVSGVVSKFKRYFHNIH